MSRLLPASYERVDGRNTTQVCDDGRIGIGFDRADGTVVRLALTVEYARAMAETLLEHIRSSVGEAE